MTLENTRELDLVNYGIQKMHESDYHGAISIFGDAIARYPISFTAHIGRAFCKAETLKGISAEDYEIGLTQHPFLA